MYMVCKIAHSGTPLPEFEYATHDDEVAPTAFEVSARARATPIDFSFTTITTTLSPFIYYLRIILIVFFREASNKCGH